MNSEAVLAKFIGIPLSVKQVEINGYTINYCEAGEGSPLLLIHGANFGWGVWYPNIADLAKHFKVYAIDLPGAGRSSRINYAHLDPEKDIIQILEKFIQILGLKNFDVVGCSIGGWSALQLAYRHPELVNKVVVENAVGLADYMSASDKVIGFYPLAKIISMTKINPKSRKKVEDFLRGIFFDKQISLQKEFFDYFFETMQTSHNLLFISRLTALHEQFNMKKELASISKDILIIWGKEDKIIPLEKNVVNFHLIPHATTVIINNAGHVPSLEKPVEFNAAVNKFLLTKEKN